MIVPDETKYRPGDRRVEDMSGFQSCIHCMRSPLTYQGQVRHDGLWFCMYFQRWKAGNDILEFLCRGYKVKSCSICRYRKRCEKEGTIGDTFCRDFRLKGAYPEAMQSGRLRKIPKGSSARAIEVEEYYWDRKMKEFEEAYGNGGRQEVGIDDDTEGGGEQD